MNILFPAIINPATKYTSLSSSLVEAPSLFSEGFRTSLPAFGGPPKVLAGKRRSLPASGRATGAGMTKLDYLIGDLISTLMSFPQAKRVGNPS